MSTLARITIAIALLVLAAPAHAQQIMPGDKGRWHGYMPQGYIGAHPSGRGPSSCSWSAESFCKVRSPKRPYPCGNGHWCSRI
jgi:hypothetical protein